MESKQGGRFKGRGYVLGGKIGSSYENWLKWLEDANELFQMFGYSPSYYDMAYEGVKNMKINPISGLPRKLKNAKQRNARIRYAGLLCLEPGKRYIWNSKVVAMAYRDSYPEDVPDEGVAFLAVRIDEDFPLDEEKILSILRKNVKAEWGGICEIPTNEIAAFYLRNFQRFRDLPKKLKMFTLKDGREYWRDFMVEDEELQRLKREGPYEEFQRYCEKLWKQYEAEPEKAEAIENGIFSPETLEVVLKSAEDRDPEDAVKMIRHVTKRGIEADYREEVSKYNFLGMLYCRACEHWNPEQIMEITKLFVESGVDASQPKWCPDPVIAVIDYLLTCSDCMPFELEPVVAYLAEHGGKIGGKKWSGVSPIDDTLEGEKQREAMILRERYGKKEGGEQNDL